MHSRGQFLFLKISSRTILVFLNPEHLPPAPGGGGEHLPVLEDGGDDGGGAGVAEARPEAQGAPRLHPHQVQVVPVLVLIYRNTIVFLPKTTKIIIF